MKRRRSKGFRPVTIPGEAFPPAGEKKNGAEKKESAPEGKKRWARELFLLPVKGYRRWISPLFPPVCKYSPSCSTYCLEAVREHGIFRGSALSVWRILRCNPFSRGGYDPVPPRRTRRKGRKE